MSEHYLMIAKTRTLPDDISKNLRCCLMILKAKDMSRRFGMSTKLPFHQRIYLAQHEKFMSTPRSEHHIIEYHPNIGAE